MSGSVAGVRRGGAAAADGVDGVGGCGSGVDGRLAMKAVRPEEADVDVLAAHMDGTGDAARGGVEGNHSLEF
ncbi:MAG: hypothetical protein HC767_03000 [Akkermansiaceae bacterium]|nr:hypothetical protein [Akkermansiaceae bacterium]